MTHFKDESHILYLAGGIESDPCLCTVVENGFSFTDPLYHSTQEEADDRLMKSLHVLYEKKRDCTITVYTPDTDILVVLLYHLKNTWTDLKLYLLKQAASRYVEPKREAIVSIKCYVKILERVHYR